MRWNRFRGGGPWAILDDESFSLHVRTGDRKALEATMRRAAEAVRRDPQAPGHTSAHEPPARKTLHRLPGVRDWRPTQSIIQRRIVIEPAHELGTRDREDALREWCSRNLKGLAWHAVIHASEAENDVRNWHAHVVYSNVGVERRASGVGRTFEDEEKHPKPNESIRTLSGKEPLKGHRRNALIQAWRRDIAALQSTRLAALGVDKVYDHPSYAATGVDRVAGEHLGRGRFRRKLDGTTRAMGRRPAAWTDAKEALTERLRREGADPKTREAARDLLELHRLIHILSADADDARPETRTRPRRSGRGVPRPGRPERRTRGQPRDRGVARGHHLGTRTRSHRLVGQDVPRHGGDHRSVVRRRDR